MEFRWNDWNITHIGSHGVLPIEAEQVVLSAKRPFPIRREDEKWLVWGRTNEGRVLQAIYLVDPDDTLFIVHARPLSRREKQQFARRQK